jgi:hypothetical protein
MAIHIFSGTGISGTNPGILTQLVNRLTSYEQINARNLDADKPYIGQRDARLKRIFRVDWHKAKERPQTPNV